MIRDQRELLRSVQEFQWLLLGLVFVSLIVGFSVGMTLVMMKFQLVPAMVAALLMAFVALASLTGYVISKLKHLAAA